MPRLFLNIRFHSGRYHGLDAEGRPEWPPAPARLFQAFVAGAAKGANLLKEDQQALQWLEQLQAPVIAAPAVHKGQSFRHFMPNNDLDAVGGNPSRLGEIRTATKWFRPHIFDISTSFIYVWSYNQGEEHAERICSIADRLYQLGRGVDMAWAVAEILDASEAEVRLSAYPSAKYLPSANGDGLSLLCPYPGSLESLLDRYEKNRTRFKDVVVLSSRKKSVEQTFSQAPKPRFRPVFYNCPPVRLLYELRDLRGNARFLSWPLHSTAQLVTKIRNDAATRLKNSFPKKGLIVNRTFGLSRNATEADKAIRIRIVPLPSIGHPYADHGLRRILIEIPPSCPFSAEDIAWAFSGVGDIDHETGEVHWMLVSAQDRGMLAHYGIGQDAKEGFRTWHTVTPMALSVARSKDRKIGSGRAAAESSGAVAVANALRHAGTATKPISIRIQREPFDVKGLRAENFAPGTRFASARLQHVEIAFAEPVVGPLLIGDGRYLGLGLMRPVKQSKDAFALAIANDPPRQLNPLVITHALRRAVMALVQEELGAKAPLPTFFTGHENDGSPARRGGRSHLAFAYDSSKKRLLVIAPNLMEGRQPSGSERKYLKVLEGALSELHELRTGSAGLFHLKPLNIDEDSDQLFTQRKTWITQTRFYPTRYSKDNTPEQMIIADLERELHRRGYPQPERIDRVKVAHGPRSGLSAQARLVFATAVKGPLLLGKNCNLGNGLFVGTR